MNGFWELFPIYIFLGDPAQHIKHAVRGPKTWQHLTMHRNGHNLGKNLTFLSEAIF